MSKDHKLEVHMQDGVAEVVFWSKKANSLPREILTELASEITRLGELPDVRVIVIGSEGEGAFCAGASFDELKEIDTFDKGKHFFMGFAEVILAIRNVPKFVIARVHGKAVGGGVGIAAAADYALAHVSASVKLSELDLGLGPFVVGPAVERKIGLSQFSALSMDTEWRDADWALHNGLHNLLADSYADLDEALVGVTRKLVNGSGEAMKSLKKVLWEGTENWESLLEERAEISGRLVTSSFTKSFLSA